jgi:hypothetical protein
MIINSAPLFLTSHLYYCHFGFFFCVACRYQIRKERKKKKRKEDVVLIGLVVIL